jgi:hypothetical protein
MGTNQALVHHAKKKKTHILRRGRINTNKRGVLSSHNLRVEESCLGNGEECELWIPFGCNDFLELVGADLMDELNEIRDTTTLLYERKWW